MYFEFRLENNTGAIYITHDNDIVNIDYRFELFKDDYGWQGHYSSKIINGKISEEHLNIGVDYDVTIKTIKSSLKNLNDSILIDLIKNSYLNNKVKLTRF